MTFAESNSTTATIVQGSVTTIAVTFLYDTVTLMFPFLIATIVLIIADLFFGIGAAHRRGETVRLSRAIRRTVSKTFEYICWVVVSASLSVAFNISQLNWIILAVVVGNEMISIFTNWLFIHGKKVSGLNDLLVHWVSKKIGADASDVKIEDIDTKNEA